MPPPHSQFRSLQDEFRDFVDRRGAWPSLKAFKARFEAEGLGYDKADVTGMKRGAAIPEKYVVKLIELMRGKAALGEFLACRGKQEQAGLTIEAIMELAANPSQPNAGLAPESTDWVMSGIGGLTGIFTDFVWRTLIRPGTLCESEEDVRAAVTMILVHFGREIAGSQLLPAAEAVSITEQLMKVSASFFLERAMDLWRKAKWSLAFAVVDRQRVGCSLVLPLEESVYLELREAKRNTHSCTSNEICTPSSCLFIEAACWKSDAEYPSLEKKTIQTMRVLFLQFAALSLADGMEPFQEKRPLRILSIGGYAKNEARLKRLGFQRTGTIMPGFDIPFMEMDERKAWLVPLVVKKLQERLIETGYRA